MKNKLKFWKKKIKIIYKTALVLEWRGFLVVLDVFSTIVFVVVLQFDESSDFDARDSIIKTAFITLESLCIGVDWTDFDLDSGTLNFAYFIQIIY